ncbi:signal recognition particle 14 kDa protein-like [Watersipora subatra]|uniref:signal recognition particle 14 kDa protein-like n=1 Tax=Watersipora subatra TaxID=2589382 RepID=UPI00355B08E0
MPRLENDKFLSELTKLFQTAETSGNVVLTMKTYDGRTKPVPRKSSKAPKRKRVPSEQHSEPAEHQCLIRAAKGNKKISTVVLHKEVNRFQLAYANLLRGNMTGLKKKARGKGDKSKQKLTQ